MDRILRAVNALLLILVTVLMLSAIFCFFNVLLFYYGKEKMELGSVSDWLSFICNAVMASSAVYAAVNAKNWISGKQKDSAYNHVSSLMAEYDLISGNLKQLYFKVVNANVHNPDFDILRNEIEKNAYLVIALQSKLNASRRWRVGHSTELNDAFNVLLTFCNESYYLFGAHLSSNEDAIVTKRSSLSTLFNRIQEQEQLLNKDITDIFSFSR